jgi:hypothetical protein
MYRLHREQAPSHSGGPLLMRAADGSGFALDRCGVSNALDRSLRRLGSDYIRPQRSGIKIKGWPKCRIFFEKNVFIFIHNSKHLIPLNLYPSGETTGHVVAPKRIALGCA